MQFLRTLFRSKNRLHVERLARDLASDHPELFFYVREWACRPMSTREDVTRALELADGNAKDVSFVEGIAATETQRRVFVVSFEEAVFVFAKTLGFSNAADRLSRGGPAERSAYSIYLDDKRTNILCSRSLAGQIVRQIAYNDGFSQDGTPGPGEPTFVSSDPDDPYEGIVQLDVVLDLATAWGPDPRKLVRGAPHGWLYSPPRDWLHAGSSS
jgi:hypothetical protein